MSGLTLAIVKRDTGKYSVLEKSTTIDGVLFWKKEVTSYNAYANYYYGGECITHSSESVWAFDSIRFDTFELAKTAAIAVFQARNEARRDTDYKVVEEVNAITYLESVSSDIS